jgi:hypothetical protein
MSHDLGRDHIVVGFTTTSAISVYDKELSFSRDEKDAGFSKFYQYFTIYWFYFFLKFEHFA